MRSFFLFIYLLATPIVVLAAPEVATIEGIVDLSQNNLSDWPYAGKYTDKYLVKITVRAAASGAATVKYGKLTRFEDGFRYDSCGTALYWSGGEIEARLINTATGALISTVTQSMTLSTGFEDPTTEFAICYPHDYPNFTKSAVLTWDYLVLKIDEKRSLRVRPFTFLDEFSLWGTSAAVKQNGEYILKSFSIADGLKDTIYDSSAKKERPALSYMFWDHYNADHTMPLPGQPDASGTASDMNLLP